MTLQQILFFVAIAFFVLAAICIALALFLFFVRNIPDVRADLTGKKRANAISSMENARPGRDGRKGAARNEPSGALVPDLRQVDGRAVVEAATQETNPAPAQQEAPAPSSAGGRLQWQTGAPVRDDSSATKILSDDDGATTIIGQQPDDGGASVIDIGQSDDSANQPSSPQEDGFVVVRKVVLMESTRIVKVE